MASLLGIFSSVGSPRRSQWSPPTPTRDSPTSPRSNVRSPPRSPYEILPISLPTTPVDRQKMDVRDLSEFVRFNAPETTSPLMASLIMEKQITAHTLISLSEDDLETVTQGNHRVAEDLYDISIQLQGHRTSKKPRTLKDIVKELSEEADMPEPPSAIEAAEFDWSASPLMNPVELPLNSPTAHGDQGGYSGLALQTGHTPTAGMSTLEELDGLFLPSSPTANTTNAVPPPQQVTPVDLLAKSPPHIRIELPTQHDVVHDSANDSAFEPTEFSLLRTPAMNRVGNVESDSQTVVGKGRDDAQQEGSEESRSVLIGDQSTASAQTDFDEDEEGDAGVDDEGTDEDEIEVDGDDPEDEDEDEEDDEVGDKDIQDPGHNQPFTTAESQTVPVEDRDDHSNINASGQTSEESVPPVSGDGRATSASAEGSSLTDADGAALQHITDAGDDHERHTETHTLEVQDDHELYHENEEDIDDQAVDSDLDIDGLTTESEGEDEDDVELVEHANTETAATLQEHIALGSDAPLINFDDDTDSTSQTVLGEGLKEFFRALDGIFSDSSLSSDLAGDEPLGDEDISQPPDATVSTAFPVSENAVDTVSPLDSSPALSYHELDAAPREPELRSPVEPGNASSAQVPWTPVEMPSLSDEPVISPHLATHPLSEPVAPELADVRSQTPNRPHHQRTASSDRTLWSLSESRLASWDTPLPRRSLRIRRHSSIGAESHGPDISARPLPFPVTGSQTAEQPHRSTDGSPRRGRLNSTPPSCFSPLLRVRTSSPSPAGRWYKNFSRKFMW